MLFQFECRVNDNDYYEFNRYFMFHSSYGKKNLFKIRMFVPIILSLMFIYYLISGESLDWLYYELVSFVITSVVWIIAVKPFYLLILKINQKSMKKSGKLPYSELSTMEFYDDHFIDITPDARYELKYDAVDNVVINESKAIYIYRDMMAGHIIPFSTFKSEEERNRFIDFMHTKTNK